MMLLRFRHFKHHFAAIAVTLAVHVLVAPVVWWHAADDDDIPAVTFHDHSAHRAVVGAQAPLSVQEHCYICHLLRSLQNSLGLNAPRKASAISSSTPQPPAIVAPSRPLTAQLPARAPPA
jgi:hypothetical protein